MASLKGKVGYIRALISKKRAELYKLDRLLDELQELCPHIEVTYKSEGVYINHHCEYCNKEWVVKAS